MQSQQLSLFELKPKSQNSTIENISNSLGFSFGSKWPDYFGAALHGWSTKNITNPIKTLSLFSGGGGLDIGFHDAGFTVQTMLEIDKRFATTLEENSDLDDYFGSVEVVCGDIREYTPPQGFEVDFIIGGPPCQTFSAAGRRAAGVQGTDDNRGVLFREYVRILRQLSPKGFLFENVYGITGAQNGDAWQEIRQAFEEVGYKIFYRILDAADYGVPQHRERLFIVGTKDEDFLFPRPTHGPDSPAQYQHFSAAEAIAGADASEIPSDFVLGGRFGYLLQDIPPGLNYSFYTEKMGHPNPVFAWRSKFSDFLYKADPDRPVRTIKAQGGQYTGPFHWNSRPFSVNELKRLQTFPDSYDLVGGRQIAIHQIGNSVPPQLARILAASILEQLFQINLPFQLPLLEHYQELGFRKRKRHLTTLYQAKAKAAIKQLKVTAGPDISEHSYIAILNDKFDWIKIELPEQTDVFYIKFTPDTQVWQFFVSTYPTAKNYPLQIVVTPSSEMEWGLNVKRVELLGTEMTPKLFTALWKAFEAELAHSKIKADLVQLRGYYQYKAAINCSMIFEEDVLDDKWQVVQKVVSGVGVGDILTTQELRQVWKVPKEKIFDYALFLRHLGYEARNENTNAQIPKGHFLIPYSFPTLNPLSVQLRKSLEIAQ